jgi:hypothetical protein
VVRGAVARAARSASVAITTTSAGFSQGVIYAALAVGFAVTSAVAWVRRGFIAASPARTGAEAGVGLTATESANERTATEPANPRTATDQDH